MRVGGRGVEALEGMEGARRSEKERDGERRREEEKLEEREDERGENEACHSK